MAGRKVDMIKEKKRRVSSRVEFCSSDGFRQDYDLAKLRISIGAQAEADIAFPTLLFEHAELTHEQGEWVIRKRHPDAVIEFRGYPVELKKLNPGDKLFLGGGTLTFIGSGNEEITAITELEHMSVSGEQFEMTVQNGPEKGRVITLDIGEYTIGRAEKKFVCSSNLRRIEFDHPYVSRTHARLYVDYSRIRVQDMLSTNGTRINRRLIKTGEIKAGDKLFLGKLKLKITGPKIKNTNSAQTVRVKLKDTTWRKWGWRLLLFYAAFIGLLYYLLKLYLF